MSWERLGEEVRRRRKELELTQKAAAERGGLSLATFSAIEANRSGKLTPRLRRALERALEWAPGSVDVVLKGGVARVNDATTPAALAVRVEGPISQQSAAERIGMAERLLRMQQTFTAHGDAMPESARAAVGKELAAAARELEDALVWMLPWLGDDLRAEAIRLLAQLSDVGTRE